MSEVQSRPAASRGGRGSGRGGRGAFAARGGGRTASRSHGTNGDANAKSDADGSTLAAFEDDIEIARLKKLYGSKTAPIKEMFPDWSEVDILFALQETEGDQNLAVTRIAEGAISQWGQVSKQKKDKSRSKVKDANPAAPDASATATARPARGGRTGTDGGRGRGRATERGGRGTSRARSAQTNGARHKENQQLSVATEESSTWDNAKPSDDTAGWGDSTASWDTATAPAEPAPPASSDPAAAATSKASIIPDGSRRTWASMLRQSTAPKPAPKPKEAASPQFTEPGMEPLPPAEPTSVEPESVPSVTKVVVPEIALPPPKDELTETNLERIADDSHPPVTETTASEAADSWDPRTAVPISATATPISASQHQHQTATRAAASGFATTAFKATERTANRTPSYQRRVLDQEEAVRMPGNRDQVDRATVQFGAFSLNGLDDDIDGNREEPETRAQPPDDSPIAQPRASLPPVSQIFSSQDPFSQTKPAPGLPQPAGTTAAPGPSAGQSSTAASQAANPASYQTSQGTASTQQFGRFGQAAGQDQSGFAQKPFDSFNQQSDTGYQSQQATQAQGQQHSTSFTSAPSDYSSYYTADQQGRAPYNYYNQSYGQQQSSQTQQEGLPSQQRAFGFNAPQSDNLSQYPQSASQHGQSRYGAAAAADVQNSGNNTPNPTATQSQQTSVQASQAQTQSQGQTQGQQQGQQQPQQQPADMPYSHPYYGSAYYSSYMNQYPGGYNQGAYGGPYGKGGMYGQPHQYGMSPQGPYGHGSSAATGFNQSPLHRADSGAGSGLGEFARAGSAQSGNQPGITGSGFSSMHDTFGRGSSYQSQSGQSFTAPSGQSGSGPSASDDLKPFGDSKVATGPSPSLSGAARPGSATNNAQSQSGLPPPQSNQQGGFGSSGYGGFPGHLQGHGMHGNQSGQGSYGMSQGTAQGHGNSGYGGYNTQGFGSGSFYSQQPRGWGGNYH